MGWIVAALILAYVVAVRIVAGRYYAQRHGVSLQTRGRGWRTAVNFGFAWPLTLFVPALRAPVPCSHREHILERERLLQKYEAEEQIIRQHNARGR